MRLPRPAPVAARLPIPLLVLTALLAGAAWPGAAVARVSAPEAVARASARPASAPPVGRAIAWRPCRDPYLRSYRAQCGTLRVPLDHTRPSGPSISIAVSRVLHTATPYRGVMFTNPGGPGGSGTYLAAYGPVYGDAGRSYDWYGIDPRGVGASRPALTCDGSYFGFDRQPYRPSSGSILRYWVRKTRGYAADCGRASARRLLGHLRTTDNVADLEALRRSLGVAKVSFFGYSYGTYLAQVYATLHPRSLKRVVMDGVIDPRRVFYRSNLDQDVAFETTIRRFFAWAGGHDRDFHLGRGGRAVRATYLRLRRQVTRTPGAGGRVGPDELDDAVLGAGYYVTTWVDVARALQALDRGNAGPIRARYRGANPVGRGADNGYAVYLATECTDAVWPRSWSTWGRDNRRVDQRAPYLTWGNAWFNAPCRTWPVRGSRRVAVTGRALRVPVLLLSETKDGATPFSGALATRRLFPTSALVAGVGGTTHAASGYAGPCVKGAVMRYLASGALPRRRPGDRYDLGCAPVAPPTVSDRSARVLRADRSGSWVRSP